MERNFKGVLTCRPSKKGDKVDKTVEILNEKQQKEYWTVDIFDIFVSKNQRCAPGTVCFSSKFS